jgi:hypothetical protein
MGAIDELLTMTLMDCIQVMYNVKNLKIGIYNIIRMYALMINVEWIDTLRSDYNCWDRKHLPHNTNIYDWINLLQTSSILHVYFSQYKTIRRN